MTTFKRTFTTVTALAICALVFGFIIFGAIATQVSNHAEMRADGIVVLTGGGARISAASDLLREGRAKRLLISGVNKSTRRSDLLRLSGLPASTFDCCVDVDYALNTVGNANGTQSWAKEKNFKSIIVVTSGYHMPRSLMELSRALPDAKLIPYSVMPPSLRRHKWWLHRTTMRVLLSEYLKLIPAAARYTASRIVGEWSTNTRAQTPKPMRANS